VLEQQCLPLDAISTAGEASSKAPVRWRIVDASTGEILIEHLPRSAAQHWHDAYLRQGIEVVLLPDKRNPNPYAPDASP